MEEEQKCSPNTRSSERSSPAPTSGKRVGQEDITEVFDKGGTLAPAEKKTKTSHHVGGEEGGHKYELHRDALSIKSDGIMDCGSSQNNIDALRHT